MMTAEETRAFVRDHHHAVLVTRRRDGGVQTSPVLCGLDDEGYVVISATDDRAKVKNLHRDPQATLCCFTDRFFGPWIQLEGEAQIVELPEALGGLEDLYRQIKGEHPRWAEFRAEMVAEQRCLIRIPISD